MSIMAGPRLTDVFAKRKQEGRGVFAAYITVGDPSLERTLSAARILAQQGVDILELGVPFSDPVADGPIIQAASERALERQVNLADVFAIARQLRAEFPLLGIVLMGYANPFFRLGLREAATQSGEAGVDAWIVPDVPFEESWRFREYLSAANVAFVPLLAPTTSCSRAAQIVRDVKAPFAYYVSVTGVTGVRSGFESGWHRPLDELRSIVDTPIVVGFGIGDRNSAAEAIRHADGVVVGSALVRNLAAGASDDELATFVRDLRNSI